MLIFSILLAHTIVISFIYIARLSHLAPLSLLFIGYSLVLLAFIYLSLLILLTRALLLLGQVLGLFISHPDCR